MAHRPTYIDAALVAERGAPDGDCGKTRGFRVRCEFYPLEPDLLSGDLRFLRLARAIYDD